MHHHAMHIRADRLQGALATMAAPKRFDLLVLMLGGKDRSVSQLAEAVGLSQSCTTRHLQALARAGLVKRVRDGKRVVFRIAPRDAEARAVLASLGGGTVAPPGTTAGQPARSPAHRRQRSRPPGEGRDEEARRKLLEAAVRIESSAELEPLVAGDGDRTEEPSGILRPESESGRTSEPEPAPAWQRSDLEDFLL